MHGSKMESEIRQQPSALRENSKRYLDQLRGVFESRRFEMVLLAARGSSDHAALYAKYLFEIHLGIPVSLAAPSVITKYGSRLKYPNCLAIGISQSGEAPDVSEVLEHLRSSGHATLAITNTSASRLTKVADATLLLGAGDEEAVAATKTYTSSLLALYQTARALGADLQEPILPDDQWTELTKAAAADSVGPILRCSPLFALARGYSFSSAHETALKLMECALLPCKAYSTADFEHGPKALAGAQTAAIVYGDTPQSLFDLGCVQVIAPETPDPAISPIWDAFYGQWLALLAARARGIDPDHPQNIHKITKTL
ncbi:MAG: SIS domain-containing protein [Armatimonadetes bacterium]|nr:SIS domain-containing protein [Armatimonadota bacterium]